MIISHLELSRPFDHRDLAWCRTDFVPSDTTELHFKDSTWGWVEIKLPTQLNQAAEKRRTEFLAGRLCAAYALRQLGRPEVVGRRDRAPVWPAGVTGSITHTDQRAFAVASASGGSLGVDCEPLMSVALARDIFSMVISKEEDSLRPSYMSSAAFITIAFSAKEAFYKAISSSIDRVLEFHEVTLISIEKAAIDLQFEGVEYRLMWRTVSGDFLVLCRIES